MRGYNPNSQKALARNRVRTMFSGESAVKACERSAQVRHEKALFKRAFRKEALRVLVYDKLTEAELNAMACALIASATQGDLDAIKLIIDILDE